MSDAVDALTHRLDRLERENRWLKRIGGVVLVGLAAVVLMGQAGPRNRIVEAEKFVLVDKGGKVRAVLGAASFGIHGDVSPARASAATVRRSPRRVIALARAPRRSSTPGHPSPVEVPSPGAVRPARPAAPA